jgi:hypothetical protein
MEMTKTVVAIIAAVLVLGFGSMAVFGLASQDTRPEYVKGITVYVNADGTDATHIKGAIYNANGYLVATTNAYEIVGDSWNVLYLPSDVRLDTKDRSYILTVQGDGDISVPSSGEDYITEAATYGTFPASLSDITSTSDLSIYAIYR